MSHDTNPAPFVPDRESHQQLPPPALDRAVSKIFRRLIPLVTAMFVINYIDRVNIGYARDSMEADIGLGAAAYGLGAGLFFIAYAIFEIPSNVLMLRYGPKIWLTRIMVSWGAVAMAMALTRGETSFYVLRFLLGTAEAGFSAGVIFLFTRWVPEWKRGRAMAIFFSGSSIGLIVAGPLSGLLLGMDGFVGLNGWQWLFVIQGGIAVLFAIVVWELLDDSVEKATWLDEGEKKAVITVLRQEQRSREAQRDHAHVSRIRLLLRREMLLYCWVFFAAQLTIYATTFWLPTVVRDIGDLSDFQTGLLSSIPWICAIVGMYVMGHASDKVADRRPFVSVSFAIAAIGMFFAARTGPLAALISLCLAAIGFKAAAALFMTIPQRTLDASVSGPGLALITSIGNLGGFVAPFAFGILEDRTGSTEGGLYALSVTSLIAAGTVFAIHKPDAVPSLVTGAVKGVPDATAAMRGELNEK